MSDSDIITGSTEELVKELAKIAGKKIEIILYYLDNKNNQELEQVALVERVSQLKEGEQFISLTLPNKVNPKYGTGVYGVNPPQKIVSFDSQNYKITGYKILD